MSQTKTDERSEEEYATFLIRSEGKIRAFFLRLLYESIKLYGDIAPKTKEGDGWYGIDDLWDLITKINALSSCREEMMGSAYYFDHEIQLIKGGPIKK